MYGIDINVHPFFSTCNTYTVETTIPVSLYFKYSASDYSLVPIDRYTPTLLLQYCTELSVSHSVYQYKHNRKKTDKNRRNYIEKEMEPGGAEISLNPLMCVI